MRSAGHQRFSSTEFFGWSRLAQEAVPESIQTSRMSDSLLAFPPHLHLTSILSTPFLWSSNSFGGGSASLTSSAFEPITVCSPHFSQVHTGSGTPQYRWRDITQSLAPASQSWNLLDTAHSGTHRTFSFSLSIFSLIEVTL